MSFSSYFSSRIKKFQQDFNKNALLSRNFTWIRGIVFLIWIVALYKSTYSNPETFIFVLLVGGLFFFLIVIRHNKVESRKNFLKELISLNQEELKRLEGKKDHLPAGSQYIDKSHPYSYDLDLFGKNSLFVELNRCRIPTSRDLLAKWLTTPTNLEDTSNRQIAIQQLARNMDWVQEFEAGIDSGYEQTLSWQDSGDNVKGWLRWLAFGLTLVSATILALWVTIQLPIGYLWISLILNGLYLGVFQKRLIDIGPRTHWLEMVVKLYLHPFQYLEKMEPGSSELLQNIKSVITTEAITEIKKINKLVYAYDNRANMMYWIVNIFLLIDVHLFFFLQKWMNRNRKSFENWIHQIHMLEALNSMAIYHFIHPQYSFPHLANEPGVFKAKNIRHPLIPEEESVANDFEFEGQKVSLITGSNMSGKSTFLRTIGINQLMAWIGLPVAADQLVCSQFNIFCGMRTEDDLSQHTSSFYAELKRIKQLFDTIEESKVPVVYFLDEILKGTNSKDRHLGAKGIIRRLANAPAYGFVSTHDLDLSDDFQKDDRIRDFSFNSQLIDNRLDFDYKLTSGKCISTNASELLRIMGITEY